MGWLKNLFTKEDAVDRWCCANKERMDRLTADIIKARNNGVKGSGHSDATSKEDES